LRTEIIPSTIKYDPAKFKYRQGFPDLPMSYTHMEVVAKFGWRVASGEVNNFVLTAYLIEKW
jgi:hypothetical protein